MNSIHIQVKIDTNSRGHSLYINVATLYKPLIHYSMACMIRDFSKY